MQCHSNQGAGKHPVSPNEKKKRKFFLLEVCLALYIILEKLIMVQLSKKLRTKDDQFAYKRDMGAKLHWCETALKLVSKFHNNCELFYALFLDASAAFDCVSHQRFQNALC